MNATIKNESKSKYESDFEKSNTAVECSDRNAKIAELAYYKAEQRGFVSGRELDDWLEAEQELME